MLLGIQTREAFFFYTMDGQRVRIRYTIQVHLNEREIAKKRFVRIKNPISAGERANTAQGVYEPLNK